jgi:hypothetical protein
MNWLLNLKGQPHEFREVDWLVEHNNLMTKACATLVGEYVAD